MHLSRRRFLQHVSMLAGSALLAGCRPSVPRSRSERIEAALNDAAFYLLPQQGTDGAWRSAVYGQFKDGLSLTPLVLAALQGMPASEKLRVAQSEGAKYLTSFAKQDGSIDSGKDAISYPAYTSAGVVSALSRPEHAEHRKATDAWLAYLLRRQLTEELGWEPTDKEYGGWGYCAVLPKKPKPGEGGPPLNESNLSATIFAVDALRTAGIPANDSILQKALVFIQRCQNYSDDPEHSDPAFDDGGFFFIYDDPVRNKAGMAGKDRRGRARFYSYGSTTADGLRALLACGLPLDHPRVVAARGWLAKHFRADTHPGTYTKEHEENREAVYYYYAASVAKALRAAGVKEIPSPTGKVRWPEALADELLSLQRKDGSWVNGAKAVREDDPVVATCFAASALALCR